MLMIMGILFGSIFGYILFKNIMMKRYLREANIQIVSVSTIKTEYQEWQSEVRSAGTLAPVMGVNVTTEIVGLVRELHFTPGMIVKKDDLLVSMNDDIETATLHSLQASAALAKTVYERDKAQYAIGGVSKATLDFDEADLKSKEAQVVAQAALVQKKKIVAPFEGRLGITSVRPGQFLNPGDNIVSLQALDPIYANFFLPQQRIKEIDVGQVIHLQMDSFPGEKFIGKISSIEPAVDVDTRNVKIQATLENPQKKLLPGMFGEVTVTLGKPQRFLTLPQTAVSFNPYGEMVYFITESKEKNKNGKPKLIANQVFVKTGEKRGDQVVILQGIKEGDTVVTSGQLKLKNGSQVAINNSVQPNNNPNPRVTNE